MSRAGANPVILLIGEAVAPTGYSRVLRSIFEHLHPHFEIHHLAPRYDGDPHDYPWRLYPAHTGGDPYGYGRLPALIGRLRPRLVFLLTDLSFQGRYMSVLREIGAGLRVVTYSPVESGPVTPELLERLAGTSRYVVYTRYGRAQMEAALAVLRRRRPDFAWPEMDIIPHGVDTDLFHPLGGPGALADPERRRRARRLHFGPTSEIEDAFIVLNANCNQPRKQLDVTMKGFALFARDKPPDVKLYLHTGIEDRGWNVVILAQRLGITDRLILTSDENHQPNLPSERLNVLYNACDVGINTSSGEGWGLVTFEHAATGAAQVVPRHTSQNELWEGAAELLEPVMSLTLTGTLNEAAIVSPEGVAAALERLYADPLHRERLAKLAYERVHRSEYRWPAIAERWRNLLHEELRELTPPG